MEETGSRKEKNKQINSNSPEFAAPISTAIKQPGPKALALIVYFIFIFISPLSPVNIKPLDMIN